MTPKLGIVSFLMVFVLVVSGCLGSGSASTSLKVAFGPDDGSRGLVVYKLTCDPAGGTIPNASAACATIANRARLVNPPPSNVTCSPPVGMWAVTITGTFHGKAVKQDFGSCDNQVFAWMRIAHYKPCPGNFTYFVTPCTHGPYAFGKAHMRGVFPDVPKVVGMTAEAARRILRRQGLQAQFVPKFEPRRRVIAQSPRPRNSVKVYAVVHLTIATS